MRALSHQLGGLAAASALWNVDGNEEHVVESFKSGLHPVSQARIVNALTRKPDTRVLIARQPILAAFRYVILNPSAIDEPAANPIFAGIVLSHAVAADLISPEVEADEDVIAGMPASFAIDLFCNLAFNSADDLFAQLDRYLRLWREYGSATSKHFGGILPETALLEATGLEVEDAVALAFGLLAWHSNLDRPDRFLAPDFNSDMDASKIDSFLELVAATPDELRAKLADQRSQWDFLAFQERPVVRLEEGLVVVDTTFLMDRVTSGLFYAVHDWAKAQSEELRRGWTQAWGDMVERLVEDSLTPHALPLLGGAAASYTEEHLEAAYPGHRVCDVVLDLGRKIAAVEVVSGRMTLATRVDGDQDAFMADMEKIVFKKLRQLDDSANCLLADPAALLGTTERRSVRPIVVAGGGFPNSPVTQAIINDYCVEHGLFHHAMIDDPVVLDVGEVEMLEGLHESGRSMMDLIDDWQASPLRAVSMRNWLMREVGSGFQQFRPARMKPQMDAFFAEMMDRLQLRPPPELAPSSPPT